VNAAAARFQRQARRLIAEKFGRSTAYAYSNRPAGSPTPKVGESTVKQWLRNEEPCMPFSDCLLSFAEEMGATLDYLVLDRGPKTPGLSRVESDLASDLRAYLVDSLCRRLAARPYHRAKTIRFFEGSLPRGQELLDAVQTLVLQEIRKNHQERAERTRAEALQLLLKKLDQTRDRETRRKLEMQVVAAVRPMGEVPLLLDEGSELPQVW
jgi:hypothetical protein